jgi:hypothetical protein
VETAKVKQCGCNNEGQDELYGSKNRVFNLTSKASQKKKVKQVSIDILYVI